MWHQRGLVSPVPCTCPPGRGCFSAISHLTSQLLPTEHLPPLAPSDPDSASRSPAPSQPPQGPQLGACSPGTVPSAWRPRQGQAARPEPARTRVLLTVDLVTGPRPAATRVHPRAPGGSTPRPRCRAAGQAEPEEGLRAGRHAQPSALLARPPTAASALALLLGPAAPRLLRRPRTQNSPSGSGLPQPWDAEQS